MDEAEFRAEYEKRTSVYARVAASIHQDFESCLKGISGIDRVAFRIKGVDSICEKIYRRKAGKYKHPFVDVEDQIAGRIIVFFPSTITSVREILTSRYNAVEDIIKQPSDFDRFGYQSLHLVVNIPPQCICRSWEEFDLKPESFEVQVRTIFMHAWAEPQHDLLYKGEDTLTEDQKRSLYWVAASAWGCDKVYNEINEGKNKK